ncbi:MAG: CoA transferase subunit A [Chloroflexota bacterium]|nr:CoA transferase subunit A [Chloroflexota bacterium]
MIDKTFASPDDALHDVADGATIMFGGFVSAGTPSNLILALQRRGTRDITGIANNIGLGDLLDVLCEKRQLAKFIATFAVRASGARKSLFEEQYARGEVALELVPQGTFVERIRAAGAGLGGVLTRVGLGTMVEEGKRTINIDGADYLLELPLRADFAFIKAYRADRMGNLAYRMAGRNFNPAMATAADVVIAEVEQIVEPGGIDPESVGTPGVYVDRVVRCDPVPVRWYG